MATSLEPEDRRRVAVWEREPYWQPELQRRFLTEPVDVRGCRSMSDVARIHRSREAEAIVLDWRVNPRECLQWLGRTATGRAIPVVVLMPDEVLGLQWSVRELNVATVLSERATTGDLAHLCRRLIGSSRR